MVLSINKMERQCTQDTSFLHITIIYNIKMARASALDKYYKLRNEGFFNFT